MIGLRDLRAVKSHTYICGNKHLMLIKDLWSKFKFPDLLFGIPTVLCNTKSYVYPLPFLFSALLSETIQREKGIWCIYTFYFSSRIVLVYNVLHTHLNVEGKPIIETCK